MTDENRTPNEPESMIEWVEPKLTIIPLQSAMAGQNPDNGNLDGAFNYS